MNSKSFNRNRIFRHILPSVFFIILFALGAFGSSLLYVNLIAGCILLLLFGNIFLQNIIISRIFGIIFLLGSLYMTFALLNDIVKGKATSDYMFGVLLILAGFVMSVLLILGYKKQAKKE